MKLLEQFFNDQKQMHYLTTEPEVCLFVYVVSLGHPPVMGSCFLHHQFMRIVHG